MFAPRKVRVNDNPHIISIQIPDDLFNKIEKYAVKYHVKKSSLLRQMLESCCEDLELTDKEEKCQGSK
jgi:metal-responsive CopG/Arc/MetJ family transcriptional regulator